MTTQGVYSLVFRTTAESGRKPPVGPLLKQGKTTQNQNPKIQEIFRSIHIVKQTVDIGVFRHAEFKPGLFFSDRLSLPPWGFGHIFVQTHYVFCPVFCKTFKGKEDVISVHQLAAKNAINSSSLVHDDMQNLMQPDQDTPTIYTKTAQTGSNSVHLIMVQPELNFLLRVADLYME